MIRKQIKQSLFFFLLLTLSGCSSPFITPTPLPTVEPRPPFIRGISPEESMVVPRKRYEDDSNIIRGLREEKHGYASNICISLDLGHLTEPGDNLLERETLFNRTELVVDDTVLAHQDGLLQGGELVTLYKADNPELGATYGALNVICWDAPLGIGVHKAVFRFFQTSGNVKEYSWYFAITR
jgi:hypothetical protein